MIHFIPSRWTYSCFQAMAMVAAREARDMERGELGAYASADVANLPPPPYYFQVQDPAHSAK